MLHWFDRCMVFVYNCMYYITVWFILTFYETASKLYSLYPYVHMFLLLWSSFTNSKHSADKYKKQNTGCKKKTFIVKGDKHYALIFQPCKLTSLTLCEKIICLPTCQQAKNYSSDFIYKIDKSLHITNSWKTKMGK